VTTMNNAFETAETILEDYHAGMPIQLLMWLVSIVLQHFELLTLLTKCIFSNSHLLQKLAQ